MNPYEEFKMQTDLSDLRVENKELKAEVEKLKSLLKLAVDDIKVLLSSDRCDNCEKACAESDCNCSTIGECRFICKWRYANEAEKVLKEGD